MPRAFRMRWSLIISTMAVVGLWIAVMDGVPSRLPINAAIKPALANSGNREDLPSPTQQNAAPPIVANEQHGGEYSPRNKEQGQALAAVDDADRARSVAHLRRLDARRSAEQVDSVWNQKVTTVASDLIGTDPDFTGASVISVSCGSTLCRLETDSPADAGQRYFAMLFIHRLAKANAELKGGGSSYFGDGKYTFYFARTGAVFPPQSDPNW